MRENGITMAVILLLSFAHDVTRNRRKTSFGDERDAQILSLAADEST
jgi:hypothetical protein